MTAYSAVAFNSNALEGLVEGLRIIAVDSFRPAERKVNIMELAAADKSVMASAYYQMRKVHVVAVLSSDSGKDAMEAKLDTLQGLLNGQEKTLAIPQSGETRNFVATLGGIIVNDYKGGFTELDIWFYCSDPFGYSNTSTQIFSTSLTGANSSTSMPNIAGSAAYQVPTITITYTAITGGTSKAVTIGNAATGQQIVITRTWATNDVLVIDSKLKKVTVNGVEVAFTGAIPEWASGTGTMDYVDTFTTRTRTMVATYNKRYN